MSTRVVELWPDMGKALRSPTAGMEKLDSSVSSALLLRQFEKVAWSAQKGWHLRTQP